MLRKDKSIPEKENKILSKEYSLKSLANLGKNKRRYKRVNHLYRFLRDKIIINIIIYIIIINSVLQTKSKYNIKRQLNSQYSYITLKINKRGDYYFFQEGKNPDEIYINGVNLTSITRHYAFTQKNNTIKLVWFDPIFSAKRMFSYRSDIEEIDLSNFDASKITDMSSMFIDCTSLKFVNLTNLNASMVRDMSYMFLRCEKLEYINTSNLILSQVKNMNYMFSFCESLKELHLSNIKIKEMTEMHNMFEYCRSLTFVDFSNFIVSVKNISSMFKYCKNLYSLNLSSFDTSQLTDMQEVFYDCYSLKDLDISSFDTSRVINMDKMFYGCRNLIYLNLSNFNTERVKTMIEMFCFSDKLKRIDLTRFNTSQVTSFRKMFSLCSSLESLDISHFDTSKVTDIGEMFQRCETLTSLNISNFDTSQVEKMDYLFSSCYNLNYLDLSNFNTKKVVTMKGFLSSCKKLYSINLNGWDTSNVENMDYMFSSCYNLTYLNITHFNTSKVKSMSYMFSSFYNFDKVDISNFNTSNVYNMIGMFQKINTLTSLNLSHFNTSIVGDMSFMFDGCEKLTSFDLGHFKIPNIRNMAYMFNNCSRITSLDLSNFDTSLVTDMKYIFNNCKNLIALNISNFNTSKLNYMEYMFSNCINLTSLDLTNFNTSLVNNMRYLFYNCTNLVDLNISNFIAKNVKYMEYMFCNCLNLTSLDLSRFDISEVVNMERMFSNCVKLNYLNISFFDTTKVTDMGYMFYNCHSLNSLDLSKFNSTKIKDCYNIFGHCSSMELVNLENFDTNNLNLGLNYFSSNIIICSKYYRWGNILVNRKNLTVNCIENEISHYEKRCFREYTNKYNRFICNICGDNYYQIYNDTKNNVTHLYCYKSVDGFYLNEEKDPIFKPCYSNCKKCDKEGNESYHNCIECKDGYKSEIKHENYLNCYNNMESETELVEKSELLSYLLNISNMSIEENKSEILDDYDNNLKSNELTQIDFTQKNVIEEDSINTMNKPEFIEIIKENLINKLKSINNNFKQDLEVEHENILVTLSTTIIQKINKNKNKTSIDFGECEIRLKKYYNIPKDDQLYIIKLDISKDGILFPKIEYEVYYPLNKSFYYLTKLNLSICKGAKIELSIPVSITDNIQKYIITSDYYNDICSLATSKNKTDITLLDRRKEFINNNMAICEQNCELIGYNYYNKKVKCFCDVKTNMSFVEKEKFDKNKLFVNLIKIKNNININIVKCYKNVFNKANIKKNIGFYIIISIFILYIITLLIFRYRSLYKLKKSINKFIIFQNSQKELQDNNSKAEFQNNNKESKLQLKNNRNIEKGKNFRALNNINLNMKNSNVKKEINNNNIFSLENNNENNKTKNKIEYKDFELNLLEYKKAIKYDKRTYIQYYLSLLKYNHLLIISFFHIIDYNSRIIKFFLFFLFFSIYLTVNALFFTDEKIHKIYEDKGSFNFIYHIPSIIYSSLISEIIDLSIKQLALSQKNLIKFKQGKNKENLKEKAKKTLKILIIKFILFFIVSFILLLFLGYYIICFCGIYINTQIILIKNTLISFALSMVYPLIKYLIPGIFRKAALNSEEKNKDYLYKFSLFLQML